MNKVISFILLDADYDIITRENERRPCIRLWGRLKSKLVEVRVYGFLPYFYAEASEAEVNRIFKQKRKIIRDWLIHITKQEKKLYFGGYFFECPGRIQYFRDL